MPKLLIPIEIADFANRLAKAKVGTLVREPICGSAVIFRCRMLRFPATHLESQAEVDRVSDFSEFLVVVWSGAGGRFERERPAIFANNSSY